MKCLSLHLLRAITSVKSNKMSQPPPTYLPGWHNEDLTRKMRYSQLGSTDLIVSQVGFGGCVVGGVYPDKGDIEEIYQVIYRNIQIYIQVQVGFLLVRRSRIKIRDQLHWHLSVLWRWEVRGGSGRGSEKSSQAHLLHCDQSWQIFIGLEESFRLQWGDCHQRIWKFPQEIAVGICWPYPGTRLRVPAGPGVYSQGHSARPHQDCGERQGEILRHHGSDSTNINTKLTGRVARLPSGGVPQSVGPHTR